MKIFPCALVLWSLGCGLPDPLEVLEPTAGCLGPFEAPKGYRINRAAVLDDEALIKSLLTHPWTANGVEHEPLLPSSKAVCESFGGVPIHVKDVDAFPCEQWWCDGMEKIRSGIFIAQHGSALLHEYLHVYDVEHFVWTSAQHPNWKGRGFYALAALYAESSDRKLLIKEAP